MELKIKNMVCRHCVAAVTGALRDLGLDVRDVVLGRAVLGEESLDAATLARLDSALRDLGFERITDHDDEIVDTIKHTINSHIAEGDSCRFNLSACIEKQRPVSYDTASRIFSQIEGRTIEKYYNACKIERVKELLGYGNMTLGEIAFATGYSSTAHLSRRFKEVTGMTPIQYLGSGLARKGINEI